MKFESDTEYENYPLEKLLAMANTYHEFLRNALGEHYSIILKLLEVERELTSRETC